MVYALGEMKVHPRVFCVPSSHPIVSPGDQEFFHQVVDQLQKDCYVLAVMPTTSSSETSAMLVRTWLWHRCWRLPQCLCCIQSSSGPSINCLPFSLSLCICRQSLLFHFSFSMIVLCTAELPNHRKFYTFMASHNIRNRVIFRCVHVLSW